MNGANRLGGNSLSDLLVFGKRAGERAAQDAAKAPAPQIDEAQLARAEGEMTRYLSGPGGEDPYRLHAELQSTMQDDACIFRDEAGRVLATLIRLVGDFDRAEDALQDAFAVALERWPAAEAPYNPRAWLVNVGRNKAIDRVRRQVTFRGKQSELTHELLNNAATSEEAFELSVLDDDVLRLIFTCCHPAFAPEVQVALTLRTVCGL